MWDEVARRIREMGGSIRTGYLAEQIITDGWQVKALETTTLGRVKRRFSRVITFSPQPQ